MARGTSDWKEELGRWLQPFLDRLGHKARRQMCPLYVSGLIGPGDRKSIQPMARRLALGEWDRKQTPICTRHRLHSVAFRSGIITTDGVPTNKAHIAQTRLVLHEAEQSFCF